MARISGVDLPRDKRVEVGLTYIFGIGATTASKICEAARGNRTAGNKDNIAIVKALFLSRKLPKANNLKRKLKKSRLFGHRFRK